MAPFLQRLLGRSRSTTDFQNASLQLRLLVAMAAIDDRISTLETDEIEDFIERTARTDRDEDRLYLVLDDLLAAPPSVEDVLTELSHHAQKTDFGKQLILRMADMAHSDDEIDHREEFFLDLVCNVFGLRPLNLHGPDENADLELQDLNNLVHRLALQSSHVA